MTRQHVSRTNQQSKSDTPLVSGILQRAAVRNVPENEVQPTSEEEATTFRESGFHHNFCQVPVSTGEMPMIQPKLKIGAVGDRYEQEADRVAQDVVQRINAPAPKRGDKDELRMKPMVQRLSDGGGMAAPPDLDTSIQGARGGGQPLTESLRQPMERAFGTDFSGVKVHTDSHSDQLNQSIQAKAFTTGQDVFFRHGAYQPGSRGGQELIAHELTHVVQQNGGTVASSPLQPQQLPQHPATDNPSASLNDRATMEISEKPSAPLEVSGEEVGFNLLSSTSVVLQRASVQDIDKAFQEYTDLIKKIKKAMDGELEDEKKVSSLIPLLKQLLNLAEDVAQDHDHEIYKSAYSGIYKFADELMTQLDVLSRNKELETILVKILDIMRKVTGDLYGEKDKNIEAIKAQQEDPVKYVASLAKIDNDVGLERVIAQAAYMSGDMFGVAAALRFDPKLGVAIFYDSRKNKDREIETKLLDFYKTKDGTQHPRVALIPVTDSDKAYKSAIAGDFSNEKLFPYGKPKILSRVHNCLSIGNVTRIVAERYSTNPEAAKAELEKEWLPEGAKEGLAKSYDSGKTIAEWVTEKGFEKGKSYAFIWFRRSGEKGGAHKELDTSEKATQQIIEVAKKGEAAEKLVIIGDSGHDLGKVADINLTEFWNESGSPFKGSGRKMQLALFAYLINNGFNIMNIGMRSGALEGPALLGVKTVFLEEKYNLQEGRMDQWQGVVPGFKRVELEHVPTKTGKDELNRLINLTIESKPEDYALAIDKINKLIENGADIVLKQGKLKETASMGISPKEGHYNPKDVEEVLQTVIKNISSQRKTTITALFGENKGQILSEMRKAIRAYQEWGKGLVKQALVALYKGPEEGLSKTDVQKMWEAVATNVGGWQMQGRKKK